MAYQQLTKDQYDKARQKFSHDQIMSMEKTRKQETSQPPASTDNSPNIAQQIGQSAIGSTLVRPAARATEAIGRTGILGENIKRGFEEQADTGQEFNMPLLGKYEVSPVKAGTSSARQIIGESLEAGSWLYGPVKAAQSVPVGLMKGITQSAGFLGKHGAIAGGMFGAGEGLQDPNASAGDVLKETAIGAGAGAAGGVVLGSALPLAPIAARAAGVGAGRFGDAVSGFADKGKDLATSGLGMARSAAEGIGNVPLRMGDRALEAAQNAAQRQATMRSAPPHIREAMKQGVPDDWVTITQHGELPDKVVRADMLELAKATTEPTYTGPRPVAKVGEQINQGPVRKLITVKDDAVKETKRVLGTLPSEPQNLRNVHDQFIEDMGMAGVSVKNGQLVAERGSRIPIGDLKFYQQVYDELVPVKGGNVPLTYQQMHQLRQKWFDVAKSDQVFTDGTTQYARRMRSFLTREIDDATGGQYSASQVKTRESLDALGQYARLIGYKGKLENISEKDLKAGETFMRVFGNASDRPMTVLDDIYKTAQKYGYEGQEDIIVQLRFADMLEDVYGGQTRSLGGQVGRATSPTADPQQTMASGIREMVKWSPYSGAIRLMRSAGLLGKRPEDIMEAFERMILTEAGRSVPTQGASPIRESISNIFDTAKKGGEDALDNIMSD